MSNSVDEAKDPSRGEISRKTNEPSNDLDGRRVRGLRRREAILKAARELFMRQGFRKTTLADIIREAGGSRETIYSFFQGKIGLFGAIISEWGDQFADFVLEPESLDTPPREFLTQLGAGLMKIWLSPQGRETHRTVLSEGVDSPELLQLWYQSGSKKVLLALSKYVEHQVEVGRLDVSDPMVFARQFQFLLYGEIAFPVISGSNEKIDIDAAVERTVNSLLHGALPTE